MPLLPARVLPGDRVAVVSPSSWPESRDAVDALLGTLQSWGLQPEVSAHIADRRGYMAGTDADRLADLNRALRDPGVRAVIASRGGCGALRLIRGVDRTAPSPVRTGTSFGRSFSTGPRPWCRPIPG
jgi:muramoyltetrapeptide carboxypeptidase